MFLLKLPHKISLACATLFQLLWWTLTINITILMHISSSLLSTKQRYWIRPTKSPSYPRTWLLLSYFMLSPWFVSCNYGTSFNHIILPQVFINAHYTAINLLLPQQRKPPDPQRIVKIHIGDSNLNSVESTTYQINQSLTYTVSKRRFDQNGSLIDRGANGSIAGADV